MRTMMMMMMIVDVDNNNNNNTEEREHDSDTNRSQGSGKEIQCTEEELRPPRREHFLRSSRIFSRVLETKGNLLSLGPQ